jgi:hypothetical protein
MNGEDRRRSLDRCSLHSGLGAHDCIADRKRALKGMIWYGLDIDNAPIHWQALKHCNTTVDI